MSLEGTFLRNRPLFYCGPWQVRDLICDQLPVDVTPCLDEQRHRDPIRRHQVTLSIRHLLVRKCSISEIGVISGTFILSAAQHPCRLGALAHGKSF